MEEVLIRLKKNGTLTDEMLKRAVSLKLITQDQADKISAMQ